MRRTVDLDKINEMLHFLKATGPFHDHAKKMFKSHHKWRSLQTRSTIDPDIYKADPRIITFLHWVEKYILCCRFLDHRQYYVNRMKERLTLLESPETLLTPKKFGEVVSRLFDSIEFADKDVLPKLRRLSCVECVRLDEALVCFDNYSFYASIIMAVSAVESRLLEMIRRSSNADVASYSFKDFTLGQLIQVFQPDTYKESKYASIKQLMPSKHLPLLALLNHYRIFSAHPTEEKITGQVAEAIVHLSFAFMTDEKTCPYDNEELECKKP